MHARKRGAVIVRYQQSDYGGRGYSRRDPEDLFISAATIRGKNRRTDYRDNITMSDLLNIAAATTSASASAVAYAVAQQLYPHGLVQKRGLEYASRHVTAIEVNGTVRCAETGDVRTLARRNTGWLRARRRRRIASRCRGRHENRRRPTISSATSRPRSSA